MDFQICFVIVLAHNLCFIVCFAPMQLYKFYRSIHLQHIFTVKLRSFKHFIFSIEYLVLL